MQFLFDVVCKSELRLLFCSAGAGALLMASDSLKSDPGRCFSC